VIVLKCRSEKSIASQPAIEGRGQVLLSRGVVLSGLQRFFADNFTCLALLTVGSFSFSVREDSDGILEARVTFGRVAGKWRKRGGTK